MSSSSSMNFDTVHYALEKLAGYEKVDPNLPIPETLGLKKAYFAKKKDESIRYGGLSPLTRRPPMHGSIKDELTPIPKDKLAAAFTLQSRT